MRDLVFKNLTSDDRKRKVISTSEITENQGMRSIVHRHFLYVVKEVRVECLQKPVTHLYILKERNTSEKKERFFCKIKGSIYVVSNGRLFSIIFIHSLKINLNIATQDLESTASKDSVI